MVTVAGALTTEVVALHPTGEALATADGDDVDLHALLESVGAQFLTDGVSVNGIQSQLDQLAARGHTGLGEVPGLWLGELLGIFLPVRDLQRGVTVALARLHLYDPGVLDT